MSSPEEDESTWLTGPEEFDPTAVEPDEPDELVPQVDIPQPPDPSENDVSPELRRAFWLIVAMVNVGLLGLSVGVMVVVFWGQLRFGGSLVVLGVLALLLGYRRYRHQRNR